MQVARWFYLQNAGFPSFDNKGKPFHHRALYSDIVKVVRENPGLTGREIAARLSKSKEYVVPLL